jgi:type IV pilus assembly protein PilO
MKLSDFRNLDFNNIGGWAQGVKLTFCALLFGLIVLAGWWFMVSDQQDDLQQRQGQETKLKSEFSAKQAKVVNLDALKQQLDEMRDMLRQLLRQLPSNTEMPELLVDVSQTALSAGLHSDLFKPGPESIKEGFYAEKPIQVRLTGTYHQFGAFISGVAALPRVVILTMHDVSLRPIAGGALSLEGTVRTYRYVEEDESAGAGAKKPAKKGGK